MFANKSSINNFGLIIYIRSARLVINYMDSFKVCFAGTFHKEFYEMTEDFTKAVVKDLIRILYEAINKEIWLVCDTQHFKVINAFMTSNVIYQIFRNFIQFFEHITIYSHTNTTQKRFSITSDLIMLSHVI